MATLTRSSTVDAPVEEVFAYALDIGKFWVWDGVALTAVDVKPGGTGTTARMYTHYLGFHMEGTVEYTEVQPDRSITAQVRFFGENPTWRFSFVPEDGSTTVIATGEWHVGVPVVGDALEGMMVKEHEAGLEAMLGHLKQQVETKVNA